METVVHKSSARAATIQAAASRAAPSRSRASTEGQPSLRLSVPGDSAEREATTVARRVVGMVGREKPPAHRFESPYLSRFAGAGVLARKTSDHSLRISRQEEGQPNVKANVDAEIRRGTTSGSPLPPGVRRFMEPRFRADFSKVKVHTSERAAKLNKQLNAQAFAVGGHIFFGKDKFKPETEEGRELIAHELTHTIQQGAAPQHGEIKRSPEVTVTSSSSSQVQRIEFPSLPDPRQWFAGKAAAIPGFTMLTVVIGYNPVTNAEVDRSAGNILRGAIEIIPGGSMITEALENHGIFDKVSTWALQQFDALKNLGSSIVEAIEQFISNLQVTDLASPGDVWDRAKKLVTDPIDQVETFAIGLKDGIVQLIKDAILRPLAGLAKNTRGYDLLCTVMGKDPITGDPVPQDAEALVGGFLNFIGEGETWAKIKKANALPRIFTWFKSALSELMGFVSEIPSLFVQAFKSLELVDIILLPRAFAKLVAVFGNFAARFISWGAEKVWKLLEIIFDVVSPGALGYIKKTGAALKGIFKDPLPFVGNLVKAAKLGFQNFAANFGGHLKAGLIDWLTGSLPGVYIPKAFSLQEIVKFVLSVLGLSWANVRQKLVKAVGEPAVKAMEVGFDIVITLVTKGPAAAWDKIKDQLANLKDMVIGGITDFVIDMVVKKAVPKIVAMFIPGAGFISAILSIYDTVMVFVNKISKIIQVVTGFVNSITAIAAGAIGAAASKVESTLAGLLALAINFLAGFAGLGKVADKVMGVINKVRAPIDKALDWLVNWIVTMAKKLFAKAFGKEKKPGQKAEPTKPGADKAEAGKPEPGKAESPAEIIAAVQNDLKQRSSDFDSAGSFSSMIGSVAQGHPGLKAIRVRKTGEGEFVIEASASPFTFVGVVNEFVTSDYGQVVASVAFDGAIIGPPVKNTKRAEHAEDKIIAQVETRLAYLKKGNKPFPAKIEIFVSQSPCKTRCAPNLSALKAAYPMIPTWIIYYKVEYLGTSGKHAADSFEALDLLKKSGFHVFRWSEALEMERQGKPIARKAATTHLSVLAASPLRVSSPNDPAEKEAETTARDIMQVKDHGHSPLMGNRGTNGFESPYIRRFAGSGIVNQSRGISNSSADVRGSSGPGSPLPPSVRHFMEPRFGADFGNVRIHTGNEAASLSRQVNADAFAVGNNIYFAKDKFQPQSHEGKELIAHELTHTLQDGSVLRRRSVRIGGLLMHITAEGKLVQLPSDMTDEEVTKLEADAKAAEKKLGKGPPPKPVPDVKKLARKEEKKRAPKPAPRAGRHAGGKGQVGAKAAAAGAALLQAVGKSKVAQYLAAKGAPPLLKGFSALGKLKQNEQTHDDAPEKLTQTEKAVVIPPSEGQSISNTGQVSTVSSYPAPVVSENKGKQKLQESLQENVPRKIEDVDNFKRDKKAQHMGADVMMVVQGDKNAVVSTFQEMEQTPPPAPPEHTPETLPPEEKAPATPAMNLGQGTIAPLQKEHTDVSNYTKDADNKLKEEGVTQEQLDMVDSGDLAQANKEKKGMEKTAQTEPGAIQKFAQQAAETVDQSLKQEEKKERSQLEAKRKTGLHATKEKQKGAKSALEKKRDEVASKINGIFQSAQDKVKKRLADLEKDSMKRFDDGNARATKQFEDDVNRDLEAYKDDRYSGWFGWARKAKDWLLGMDELPGVKAIFDRNRAVFVTGINKLVEDITADSKRVIQECKNELASAKEQIATYVSKLGPDLRGIGQKTAQEMNAKLNDLDQFINRKEEELQNKLKDKQTAAIKAIDEKIEKMKDAMSGALAKLGKLLLWAAKKFFTWALEKFGVSLATIEGIIDKGVAVLKAIFTQPIRFVKNLMNAALTGFKNFGKNFLKHLKDALFEWLTGSLEGLVLPQTWDFPGIIGVALQMIGISYQNIRKHMVDVMGEPVVATLEKTFTLVKTLITQGPMAAWEQLKDMAGEMRDAFIEAVKDFIKTKIIEQAIQWLVSLFIPGAGIIKAVIGIYDTIVFFIKKAKQIIDMIGNFLGSIAEIAAGNIGAAADAMESGLARGLSLVISFLAQLLHLSGITDKIRDAIQKIRGKVDAVLLKVAKWIAEKAKKAGRFVAQAGVTQDPNQRLQQGRQAALLVVNRFAGQRVGSPVVAPLLIAIRERYGFARLEVTPQRGRWHIIGEINPRFDQATDSLTPEALAPPEGKRTLLVGEGNFSFALSIAAKAKIGGQLVATDYLVEERRTLEKTLNENRRNTVVQSNISQLQGMGVQIERQVDATDPASYPSDTFDTVVFNHPLVLSKTEGKTVRGGERANIELIESFLMAAKQKIREGGKIIVISSLFRLQRWKLDEMAGRLGLDQQVLHFLAANFPGYQHEMTLRETGAPTVQAKEQFAIVFTVKASVQK